MDEERNFTFSKMYSKRVRTLSSCLLSLALSTLIRKTLPVVVGSNLSKVILGAAYKVNSAIWGVPMVKLSTRAAGYLGKPWDHILPFSTSRRQLPSKVEGQSNNIRLSRAPHNSTV